MQGMIGKKLGHDPGVRRKRPACPGHGHCGRTVRGVQRKTKAKTDGYEAVQLGFLPQKESRLSKAAAGRFKKRACRAPAVLAELVDAARI
jgi:hypothetical protein